LPKYRLIRVDFEEHFLFQGIGHHLKNQNTKLDYKKNTNLTYGFLKNKVLELLFNEGALEDVFLELQTLFLKNTVPIRPGRSNPRNVGKYRNRISPLVLKNQSDAV